jgi:hypothetical protein
LRSFRSAVCQFVTGGAVCPNADAAKIDSAAKAETQTPDLFMITFAICEKHKTKMRNHEKGLL